MKIKLIAVGERMPAWVSSGYLQYAKRLAGDINLELVEIKAEKRTKTGHAQRLSAKEGEKLLAAVDKQGKIIALDEHGCLWNTFDLREQLQQWREASHTVCLLVGGADGLAPACKQRASQLWSLSRLTLPHALVRVIIAEQLYRAWTLMGHHPYHRV